MLPAGIWFRVNPTSFNFRITFWHLLWKLVWTFNYFKKLWNFYLIIFNLRRFKELSPSSLWLLQKVKSLLPLSCDSNMVLSVALIFIPPHFPDGCEYFSWFVSCVTLMVGKIVTLVFYFERNQRNRFERNVAIGFSIIAHSKTYPLTQTFT